MAVQSVFGAGEFVANNLYFGFQNAAGGASSDYIINLGAASGIVGGSSVVDLSGDFSISLFNTVLGVSSSMYGGVVGGLQTSSGAADIYLTQLRSGGAGIASVAGSSVSATVTRSGINNAVATLTQVNLPASNGSGLLDSAKSWESYVEPTFSTGSFYGQSGINPDSAVSGSSVVYEDLWSASNGSISGNPQPYNYLGYFTLDAANSTLTFTPAAVPEPTSCALIGGGSLLLLALRRRSISKNA